MTHIAIIDNYDSFTYNLVQLVEQAGARVTVLRNDRFALPDLAAYDKLLLRPAAARHPNLRTDQTHPGCLPG